MRTSVAIVVLLALGLLTQGDAFGQCQHGGGGRNSQPASRPIQAGGFTQTGVNPLLAMQQAFMLQQFAAQQMRMQQFAAREQARRDQLGRRRSAAERRRAAELARREKVRAANFAKLNAADSQETLVALTRK